MPTRESVDKKMRRRIRLYVIQDMAEKGLKKADVWRLTRVDKPALSRFLAPHGELTLGLDNFVRLVRGLGLNANTIIHRPHPKERLADGEDAPRVGPQP